MNNRGQALVIILGLLVIFMITIPAVIYLVQHEGKWTVKQKRTTAAFQAAETGLDRASWRLNENLENWTIIAGGGEIPGYTGTEEYDVFAGTFNAKVIGKYCVDIKPGTNPGDIVILSIGKDPDSNEVRAIEVILTRAIINSSLDINGGLTWRPNLQVHWGPVVSYTSIDSPTRYFPRKFCLGAIGGIDSDPTPLNSDEKEYWAFEPLGTPPQVDLAAYRDLALASDIPIASGTGRIRKASGGANAVATPAGSGFFLAANNNGGIRFFGDYDLVRTTSVIYTNGSMGFSNESFLDVQAALAEGNVDFNAGSQVYIATVPVNADKEYVKHKEMNPGYTFPGEGNTLFSIPACGMHGFLYCGGNLSNAGGGSTMCGSVKVIGGVTMNTFAIYYDQAVAANIRLTNSSARMKSWREVQEPWPL